MHAPGPGSPLLLVTLVLTALLLQSVQSGPLLERGPEPSMDDWDPNLLSDDRRAATKGKTFSKALSKTPSRLSHCTEPPKRVLRQILGPAFIEMYMVEEEELYQKKKRRIEEPYSRPFYLDEDFNEVLSDQPAWEVNFNAPTMISASSVDASLNHQTSKDGSPAIPTTAEDKVLNEDPEVDHSRTRRGRTPLEGRLFHCEAPIRYRDLGDNYFPRFLREADCSKCAEAPHLQCTSRNFEVRVLRRLEECAPISNNIQSFTFLGERTTGSNGMWRKWVLERLSVSFCCVCRF